MINPYDETELTGGVGHPLGGLRPDVLEVARGALADLDMPVDEQHAVADAVVMALRANESLRASARFVFTETGRLYDLAHWPNHGDITTKLFPEIQAGDQLADDVGAWAARQLNRGLPATSEHWRIHVREETRVANEQAKLDNRRAVVEADAARRDAERAEQTPDERPWPPTVAMLRERLAEFPDDMPVVLAADPEGNGFHYFGDEVTAQVFDENDREIHMTPEDFAAEMANPETRFSEDDEPPEIDGDDFRRVAVVWP